MTILLKNLLTEGVTVKILGSNSRGYGLWNNIDDLAKWLHVNIIVPIEKTLSTHELQGTALKPITPAHTKQWLYVYIGSFPEKVRPKILGGIAHALDMHGVKTDKWSLEDNGTTLTAVIPLQKTGATDAPTISMSGGALEKIKMLLDLGEKYDGPGGSLTLSIDTETLKDHLGNYYENFEQGLVPGPPNHHIRKYLQTLEHMLEWAKAHGYKTIVAS